MKEFTRGKKILVEIEDFSVKGDGLSRIGEKPIVVPYSVPGDRLKVRITEVKKTYILGEIDEIISPSEHRIAPRCPHFGECGGCPWQMIDYRAQLAFKRDALVKLLSEFMGTSLPLGEVKRMEEPWFFRNKAQYPLKRLGSGKVIMGFYRKGTNRIVDLEECPVEYRMLNALLKPIKELLSAEKITVFARERNWGKLRYVIMRGSERRGEILVVLVARMQAVSVKLARKIVELDPLHIVGVVENINPSYGNVIFGPTFKKILGSESYKEKILGNTFRVSAGSFFQTNVVQAETLLGELRERAGESRYLLDLYSGVGLFAITLADRVQRVIGVEENPFSYFDALHNAYINDQANVEFVQGKAEGVIMTLGKPDVVVLDPPRAGLHDDVIAGLHYMKPERIFYVSCNPRSFVKDALNLIGIGYELIHISPYDFFPHTPHIEVLSEFRLKV